MKKYSSVLKKDPVLYRLIEEEAKRQREGLEMIPSENYVSPAVLETLGSILTNKYSEGYAGKRYYGGNEVIDRIELLAIDRAKKLFSVESVNVQPYSGSPANLAVQMAVCSPGDTVMGLDLTHGGHLTHGWKVSATGIFYKSVSYHVGKDGRVDFDELESLVKTHRPKLIWTGATAYVYEYEFEKFAKIADTARAYLAADVAHTSGLIAGGVHKSPVPYVHIISTTTHKTLRGPRGGMIMVTAKGLEKDPELSSKIDKAVFPGLQGGPHDHVTAAIALALEEASKSAFKQYARQIVKNAQALATALMVSGIHLVGNGTENHLILADLRNITGPGGGVFAQYALDAAGITLNKNTVPGEPSSPFYPSGIRLGTPALTTRGMTEKDMEKIAGWIWRSLSSVKPYRLPENKEERKAYAAQCKKDLNSNKAIKDIKKEIKKFTAGFPIFAW